MFPANKYHKCPDCGGMMRVTSIHDSVAFENESVSYEAEVALTLAGRIKVGRCWECLRQRGLFEETDT